MKKQSPKQREKLYRQAIATLPLIPEYPFRDLDGRLWPRCNDSVTTDARALAVIRAVAQGIIDAGIPETPAHVGDTVTTTWSCERNKRKKTRRVVVSTVNVVLMRGKHSLDRLPVIVIYAIAEDADRTNPGQMVLLDLNGVKLPFGIDEPWGEETWPSFRLEWLSPLTGRRCAAWPGEKRKANE